MIGDPLDAMLIAAGVVLTSDANAEFLRLCNLPGSHCHSIDTDVVDMTQQMTRASAEAFLGAVHQAFSFLNAPDGAGCVAYTNWKLKERWSRAVRLHGSGGGLRKGEDVLGREINLYDHCKVADLGFQAYPNGSPKSLMHLPETPEGLTDMFIARYGPSYLTGWQTNLLKLKDLGDSKDDETLHNYLLDWGCGIYPPATISVVKIAGIRLTHP